MLVGSRTRVALSDEDRAEGGVFIRPISAHVRLREGEEGGGG